MRSQMLEELRDDYTDRPMEIREESHRDSAEWRRKEEQREYEEDNFTRITTKKEGKKRRKTQTDELLSFDFGGFDRAEKKSMATTQKKSMRQRVEEVHYYNEYGFYVLMDIHRAESGAGFNSQAMHTRRIFEVGCVRILEINML